MCVYIFIYITILKNCTVRVLNAIGRAIYLKVFKALS